MILFHVLLALHLLAAVAWVGGMAFALMVLRPSLGVLEPAQRLALHGQVFRRFFLLVWHAMVLVLLTGFIMLFVTFGGFAGVNPLGARDAAARPDHERDLPRGVLRPVAGDARRAERRRGRAHPQARRRQPRAGRVDHRRRGLRALGFRSRREPAFDGEPDQGRVGPQPEPAADHVGDVRNRLVAPPELVRDLRQRLALAEQVDDPPVARRQCGDAAVDVVGVLRAGVETSD